MVQLCFKKIEQNLPPDDVRPAILILYILSNDTVKKVQDDASDALRNIIPNIKAYLFQNNEALFEQILPFLTSDDFNVQAVGASALAGSSKRLGKRFIRLVVEKLTALFADENIIVQHGCIQAISALANQFDQEFILWGCQQVAPFLSSIDENLQKEALDAFSEMQDSLEPESKKIIIKGLVQFIYDRTSQGDDGTSLSGLIKILGEQALKDLGNLFFKNLL